MNMRFYKLWDEVKQFMEMKGKPVRELNDSKWLCDLVLMVDIIKCLSELNVKLRGPNQLLSSLLSKMKSFEAKLRTKASTTLEYAGECAKLIEAFNERFKDVKSKQMEFNIFATLFNVEPVDVPDDLQHEIVELQRDDELKARYNNLPLLEVYKRYISIDEFPTLRRHILKYTSMFGTTYGCEQFFSEFTSAQWSTALQTDKHKSRKAIARSSIINTS
uniref:Uncharacterized protein n=1 Tax=Molossus molossus TaxID=27622 RepID=A0A7J8JW18_MOLMO|nr:hypothetical protein HJG59_007971 [Molossus molossus]